MNPVKGILKDNEIIISNAKDIGRLYTKSNFGTTQSNNTLKISFIEAAFLLDERKLILFHQNKPISFDQLIRIAAIDDPSFETKFIIFQNLRNRGQQITLCPEKHEFTFSLEKKNDGETEKQCYILACSERNKPDLKQYKKLIEHTQKTNAEAWLAIADEEGDVTYYTISEINLQGITEKRTYPPFIGVSLQDRVLIFNESISNQLHQKEFFGKPFGKGLQLSLVEAVHLMQRGMLIIHHPETDNPIAEKELLTLFSTHQPDLSLRTAVFNDLKERGLRVKTGFKFGTHFRGYTQSPNKSHAEYLIHAVTPHFQSSWAEISRAIRLAHSVNKIFAFAIVEEKTENISYVSLQRLRP